MAGATAREMPDRAWVRGAIEKVSAPPSGPAETGLLEFTAHKIPGVRIFIKDEASHPSGSLKHRLARSLFVYGLCNGQIGPGTPIIEASSGSTAVSEAYFAKLIDLPFVSIVPRGTSEEKIRLIHGFGGECRHVDPDHDLVAAGRQIAESMRGYYMDQFTLGERATAWQGASSIASEIYVQLAQLGLQPDWFVCGAGTGTTSCTIGRYIRLHGHHARICLADPEGSALHRQVQGTNIVALPGRSVIEGVGRQGLSPSFRPALIDRATPVPDAASIAAARVLSARMGVSCGGSTGTSFWALSEMAAARSPGEPPANFVTIRCDSGDRYRSSCFNDAWLAERGLDISSYVAELEQFLDTGKRR